MRRVVQAFTRSSSVSTSRKCGVILCAWSRDRLVAADEWLAADSLLALWSPPPPPPGRSPAGAQPASRPSRGPNRAGGSAATRRRASGAAPGTGDRRRPRGAVASIGPTPAGRGSSLYLHSRSACDKPGRLICTRSRAWLGHAPASRIVESCSERHSSTVATATNGPPGVSQLNRPDSGNFL